MKEKDTQGRCQGDARDHPDRHRGNKKIGHTKRKEGERGTGTD